MISVKKCNTLFSKYFCTIFFHPAKLKSFICSKKPASLREGDVTRMRVMQFRVQN